MSSTGWGIIGAVVCFGVFQLLKYGVGKTAAYTLTGILVVAFFVVRFFYLDRLGKLYDDVAAMPEEERNRFLQELDPETAQEFKKMDAEIAQESKKNEDDKDKG